MLRGAPQAAGPTGTVGRARATPELHGAVRSGTVGRGLNRDHRPCTGRRSYASTHAHLGTAGRETILGIAGRTRAGGAARPGAGNYASSYACLGTACRETILGIAGCEIAGSGPLIFSVICRPLKYTVFIPSLEQMGLFRTFFYNDIPLIYQAYFENMLFDLLGTHCPPPSPDFFKFIHPGLEHQLWYGRSSPQSYCSVLSHFC
jgi:hypothetical protein